MNRSYVQPRFRCTGQGFIVLAQPATMSQPRQCSLNHPPAWQHLKLMAGPGTLDDLQDPARHGHHPVHQLAAVASVSPDESQAWESSYQFIDDQPRTISVLDIGRMHHHRQQQAHGIYDDVSLSTVDLLTSIIATRPPFSVVFTLWLSMIAALGGGSLPSASRTQGRSVSLTRSHVPSMVQLRKYLYRVCQGGRSCAGPSARGIRSEANTGCRSLPPAGPLYGVGLRVWLVGVGAEDLPLFVRQVAGVRFAAHSSSLVQVQDFANTLLCYAPSLESSPSS